MNVHSAAGDLYVDKAAGLVSLVFWDTWPEMPDASVSSVVAIVPKMQKVIEDNQSNERGTNFVVSHRGSNTLRLATGCQQCALRFVDSMLDQDHHAEQSVGLAPVDPGAVRLTARGETASLPDRQLQLTTSKNALIDALAPRVEKLNADLAAKSITEEEYEGGMESVKALLRSVQEDRKVRRNPKQAPGESETKLYNLRIDRLRDRDIRAILDQLNENPDAFLQTARELNEKVLADAVTAGEAQQQQLTEAEARESALPRDSEHAAEQTSGHAESPGTTMVWGQPRSSEPDALSDSEDGGFLLIATSDGESSGNAGVLSRDFEPSEQASHEEQSSELEKAKLFVKELFAEVEAGAAAERERIETNRDEPAPAETGPDN